MRRNGVTIMAVMAIVWCALGMGYAGTIELVPLAAAAVLSALLIATAWRVAGPGPGEAAHRRIDRWVIWSSAGEGIAILIANNILLNIGAMAYFPCAMAALVGLHFVPLAYGFRYRAYYILAAAMVGIGIVGCVITDAPTRALMVGFGCACCLWVFSAALLLREAAPRLPIGSDAD